MAHGTFQQTLLAPDTLVFQLPMTRRDLLHALREDAALRSALTEALRSAPFPAYAWEMPPVVGANLERAAEFAVIAHPALARSVADSAPFEEALATATTIATFPNLGGDSILIVPHPAAAPASTHLAEFVRTAPPSVADALWTAVGNAIADWMTNSTLPVWVSTAGMGVAWLHVRLDGRPKYYRHEAYKRSDA